MAFVTSFAACSTYCIREKCFQNSLYSLLGFILLALIFLQHRKSQITTKWLFWTIIFEMKFYVPPPYYSLDLYIAIQTMFPKRNHAYLFSYLTLSLLFHHVSQKHSKQLEGSLLLIILIFYSHFCRGIEHR